MAWISSWGFTGTRINCSKIYKDPKNVGKVLPKPKVKKAKPVGGTKYHSLSWNQENSPENWVSEDILNIVAYNDVVDSSEKSCNTLKSRDKRDRRHTVGILKIWFVTNV